MYQTTTYASPVGELTLASDGTALTGLWLEGQKYFGGTSGEELAPGRPDLPVFPGGPGLAGPVLCREEAQPGGAAPGPGGHSLPAGGVGRSSRTSPTGR